MSFLSSGTPMTLSHFSVLPLTNMGGAGMEASISPPDTTAQQDSFFSMTDVFLISLITGLFTYWFFFRKKKEEIPDLPKMQSVIRPFAEGNHTMKTDTAALRLFVCFFPAPTMGCVYSAPQEEVAVERAAPVRDSSFIEKMKKTGRNIVVFYGSQTGTAEEFANRLSKDAHRYGLRGMAADPEEYDLSDLSRLSEIDKSLAVFCMATYGEGDPTDNAQDFYDWLQEADADLSGLRFAVFGLGNKTYEHFNAMGKYVDKRLEELGAQRIFELGLGDDDGNLEEDFITWREQFWPAVCEHFGVEATGEESSIRQYELVVHTDVNMNKVYTGEMGRLKSYENQKPPFDAKNPFLAQVTENRKLNEGGERHLMHLELDISNSKIRTFSQLFHCATWLPCAPPELAVYALSKESNKKHPFPCPTSYRTALTYYLDITNPPRTNVLYELAQYATDAGEQERLRKMASSAAEGKALYLSWVVEARRNILAILQDMPSLRPPIDHLCKEVGDTVLYYGCRREREDYLYREELDRFRQEGVLTQLNVAFSRDQAEKVYVQHLLKKNKENIWKLINEGNAHIYVCGDARNMARDVQNTFYEIVAEFGNMNQSQAVDYVKKLMTKGRYSLDVWS
ncbi:nadph--hypothetical protein [Limosa lapponica baueri]|uniref:NADPH--hemoprotein reductase n=1 Tax=Limosa lapponica baueri TaxID=1758121 RepID=A0A2I0TWD8_LIMLA|nr:nadph--hypothetical protein [Limosa lapponica baueri]